METKTASVKDLQDPVVRERVIRDIINHFHDKGKGKMEKKHIDHDAATEKYRALHNEDHETLFDIWFEHVGEWLTTCTDVEWFDGCDMDTVPEREFDKLVAGEEVAYTHRYPYFNTDYHNIDENDVKAYF